MKTKIINKVSTWYNTLLATEFHKGFERWVGTLIKDTPNAYDKMIDNNYIPSHLGERWDDRSYESVQKEWRDKLKSKYFY